MQNGRMNEHAPARCGLPYCYKPLHTGYKAVHGVPHMQWVIA